MYTKIEESKSGNFDNSKYTHTHTDRQKKKTTNFTSNVIYKCILYVCVYIYIYIFIHTHTHARFIHAAQRYKPCRAPPTHRRGRCKESTRASRRYLQLSLLLPQPLCSRGTPAQTVCNPATLDPLIVACVPACVMHQIHAVETVLFYI